MYINIYCCTLEQFKRKNFSHFSQNTFFLSSFLSIHMSKKSLTSFTVSADFEYRLSFFLMRERLLSTTVIIKISFCFFSSLRVVRERDGKLTISKMSSMNILCQLLFHIHTLKLLCVNNEKCMRKNNKDENYNKSYSHLLITFTTYGKNN